MGWGWWDKVFAELRWGKEELVCDFASLFVRQELGWPSFFVLLNPGKHPKVWPRKPKNKKPLHCLLKQINNNNHITFIYHIPLWAKTIYDLKSVSLMKGKTSILIRKSIKFFLTCVKTSFMKGFLSLSPFHSIESLGMLEISGSLPCLVLSRARYIAIIC